MKILFTILLVLGITISNAQQVLCLDNTTRVVIPPGKGKYNLGLFRVRNPNNNTMMFTGNIRFVYPEMKPLSWAHCGSFTKNRLDPGDSLDFEVCTQFNESLNIGDTLQAKIVFWYWFEPWDSTKGVDTLVLLSQKIIVGYGELVGDLKNVKATLPSLFPNPCHDYLTVTSIPRVFDLMGKEIFLPVIKISDEHYNISTKDIVPGFYYIKLNNCTFKILKE